MTKLVLVCPECRADLEELGARVSDATITLGHACEVHPTKLHVQAQHAVRVAPSVLRKWQANAPSLEPVPAEERAPLIAEMASRLLAGNPTASDQEIVTATETARRLYRHAVKGG